MKYIKKYEANNMEIKELMWFLSEFISNEIGFQVDRKSTYYNQFYIIIKNHKSDYGFKYHLFDISDIDHNYNDNDRYFSFTLASSLYNSDNKLPTNIKNVMFFINNIMKKNISHQNMIPFKKIQNIINEITKENLEIFISTQNYNL